MENAVGGTAEPGDTAGIGRNLRFDQDNVEGDRGLQRMKLKQSGLQFVA